ncbi:MAG: aminopeptidase [Candidatus Marinimicrobia bacterium]|nr:aminopeptidase [Candidatus Neomarinimicrobiota bacterium]
MSHKWSGIILIVILSIISIGCSNVSYLAQAASGHFRIMSSRESIKNLLKNETLDIESINKLKLILEVRKYATEELGLPKNKSYTFVSEIDKQFLGWNVYCTSKYSVEPQKWCFPISGCVVYRGYFKKFKALEYASKMKQKGFDVTFRPFNAYSTLGWYNDPLLSSHLKLNSIRLAGLIIHELAHQKIYIPGDSRFNEGFAVTVERAGVLQWLKSTGREKDIIQALKMWELEDRIVLKALNTRTQLQDIYQSGKTSQVMAQKKDSLFVDLKTFICGVNCSESYFPKIDGKDFELNNAYLVPIDTYYSLVPIFQSILNSLDNNLSQFYEIVENLGDLQYDERQNKLKSL